MDPLQPRPPRPCPAHSNDSRIFEDFKSSECAGQTATFNRRPISTETSLPSLTTAGAGILNLLSIVYALRPRLRSRLTLGGRTFPRKPWVYGGQEFNLSYRYSCLHPHFLTLHVRFPLRFDALRTLPYQSIQRTKMYSRASVCRLSPIIIGARSLDESAITHCLNDGCL